MSAMLIWKDWKSWLEIILLFTILIGLAIPLGKYIASVYQGQSLWLEKFVGPLEKGIYKFSRINALEQMSWQEYAQTVVSLGIMSFIFLYLILRLQFYLPLNPQHYLGVQPDLAFNISISFLTNTNWQSYEGEKVLSYFAQMLGLTVQNFVSAATGMAVAVALVRGITRAGSQTLGNFWVDLTRGILYILLPLSIIMAILLASQGVIQNFNDYLTLPSIDLNSPDQIIPGGPVASQVAIKQLGSNGGGFFGANSAHPFENPTPFSNFLELLSILLIPVSFVMAYGQMINKPKESKALLYLLFTIFILGFIYCTYQELHTSALNYQGKEHRFGMLSSLLWSVASTATSNGSTNCVIEFFAPLAGMVPLIFILTGEVIFGGVGQGLYSIILYILITVFIAGLMAGKMPEYLGKKIEVFEIKMTMLAILIPALIILIFSGITVQIPIINQHLSSQGAKGFTELFYAFASTTGNNGSAFSGLKANSTFFNTIFGITMFIGRYAVIIPVLAIAGSLSRKTTTLEQNLNLTRASAIATDSIVFMILVFSIILLISLLSFMPALLMGPIADHLSGLK
jgi:K+-transporting ATPase ATPase A chain